MDKLQFEWDESKASVNVRKHKAAFDGAATAFEDEQGLLIVDPELSDDEDRFILLGTSSKLRLLVVVHCYRANDSLIRIISARKANKREQRTYQQN